MDICVILMGNTEVEIPHGMRKSNREKSFQALTLTINSLSKSCTMISSTYASYTLNSAYALTEIKNNNM